MSKDNLHLRDRLAASESNFRKARQREAQSEEMKLIEIKKSTEYKHMLKILLNNQCKLDEQMKNTYKVEAELSELKQLHAKCLSKNEIQEAIDLRTEELKNELEKANKSIKQDASTEAELKKLQELVLKLAITAKEMTEVSPFTSIYAWFHSDLSHFFFSIRQKMPKSTNSYAKGTKT